MEKKMKNRKINLFLSFTTVFSFFLFCFSFSAGKKNSVNSIKSALVNPSYSENIEKIIVQSSQEILVLKSEGKWWSCENRGIKTFADKKTVSNFIKNLSKIRNMYKISDSLNGRIGLGLTEGSAQIVTVVGSNGKILSKLYFGASDSLSSRITVAAEKGKICYETEDDFSAYLKTDVNFWSIPEIFFAIKNPSNLKLSSADLHTLLSLRHGKIYGANAFPENAVFEKSITLFGQYDSLQRVDFYKSKAQEGFEYFYSQTVEPQVVKDNAVFEVSSWTYERLQKILK